MLEKIRLIRQLLDALQAELVRGSHDQVRPFERPQVWHCLWCGRRSEEHNDYVCHACGKIRPFAGGAATMRECDECHRMSLALALFCEWCGRRMDAPGGGP